MKTRFAIFFVPCLLTSCGPMIEKRFFPKPTEAQMANEVNRLSQIKVENYSPQPVGVGSLWPADDNVFLYSDRKALRVGDIVTIRIVENASANNTADTNLSRASSLNASLTSFFGKQKFLDKLGENAIKASSDSSFKGAGTTVREGQLNATITAVVKEVLPNGNLVIQGTRAVAVNHEEQYITITGVVRPEDILRDNVVLSGQVANAKIAIGGTGIVADKQNSGWATWIFDFLWPF
jgi:flagellar L-ring protein precursor FlgH